VRGSEEVLHFYEDSIVECPTSVVLLSNLGRLYMDTEYGRTGSKEHLFRAKELFEAALHIEPNHGGVLVNYAVCLQHLGDRDGAETYLNKAADADHYF